MVQVWLLVCVGFIVILLRIYICIKALLLSLGERVSNRWTVYAILYS